MITAGNRWHRPVRNRRAPTIAAPFLVAPSQLRGQRAPDVSRDERALVESAVDDRTGRISGAGHLGYPLRSAYTAAKWAVEGLIATCAMELGPSGIRVNAVAPGSVEGECMVRVIEAEADMTGRDPGEVRQRYEDQVSMRRFVSADEVAAMVVFLWGDEARSVNGQVISVDGGTESLRSGWPER